MGSNWVTLGQYIVVSSDVSWNMRAQSSIPKFLTDELEHIQRRALKIIVPHLSYSESLKDLKLPTLEERRELLYRFFLQKLEQNF